MDAMPNHPADNAAALGRQASDPTMTMLPWEGALLRIRAVARDCGYAIAVHGSTTRDLDLVAVPWSVEAVSAQDLVDTLCDVIPLVAKPSEWPIAPNPESKPWGRLSWALCGVTGVEYVDLSVAPRAGEAVPVTVWATDMTALSPKEPS
jgi:hypothetical protein